MILRDNPGIEAVLRALPERVDASVHDDIIVVRAYGAQWELRSRWIGEGFPSDLHRASLELNNQSTDGPIDVVTARRISTGTRNELEAAGVSWADTFGRANISAAPGLLIERLPPRLAPQRTSAARLSVSAGAVAETIVTLALTRADRAGNQLISAAELSDLTGYSYPQVNKVLQQFETRGYVEKSGPERGSASQRAVTSHGRLLSDWAGWHKDRHIRTLELHTLSRDVYSTLDVIGGALGPSDWAVTGWIASDLISPLSTLVPSVGCYIRREQFERAIDRLIADWDMVVVPEGGRVSVSPADPIVLRLSEYRNGVPVVPPIRVYGDLLRIGGRAEEAAQQLRETTIGF